MRNSNPFAFNFILATDSYKLTHPKMLRKNTKVVFSYTEARKGGKFPFALWVGLQAILIKYFEGKVFNQADIEEAAMVCKAHFGTDEQFDRAGWEYLLKKYDGRIPIRIRAVPEGLFVPEGNVLMTIENLDENVPWLTNHCESILLHVWSSVTTGTLSGATKYFLASKCVQAGGVKADSNFMLHDFGYRGCSSHESAGFQGMAHLVNFLGTDTIEAMRVAHEFYNAPYETLAFSVNATEHMIMTSDGEAGEHAIVEDLLKKYRDCILSLVADSYNIYRFVDYVLSQEKRIMTNGIKLVIRPDSVTPEHDTPEKLVVWILKRIYEHCQSEKGAVKVTCLNGEGRKAYILLPAHFRVLWGDGIDLEGIQKIVNAAMDAGFAPQNLVFGMGGGLLQKVNRDTLRFATKCCSQLRELKDGSRVWVDVKKNPLGSNKASKGGRLTLIKRDGEFRTVNIDTELSLADDIEVLQTVFEHGRLVNPTTFDVIRERALDWTVLDAVDWTVAA